MASQIIAEYKQALINGNLGDEYINDNQDAKVIRINTCSKKTGALYLDADHIRQPCMTNKVNIDLFGLSCYS